ncbi:MAG: UDP-N-acetylmuramoyl-tripeptide--D-alanyl-D-alanine ligase [Bacteroidales bacterium]|nr:UDP-N-acetylmuramoyl-tripeptide--D-alanyl-D-alanine ligase [Bacteroidales bacterium]
MRIEDLHKRFLTSGSVTTDSRNCTPGSIYFALRGDHFDGNDFAGEAIRKGCTLAVADRKDLQGMDKVVVVDSALKTLQSLASYHRKQKGIPILAITGSNGKTTTKELVAAVMERKYRVLYTSGNLNNHIGVPLTLLNILDHTFGVIEMGANHMGEIGLLADIASPDYGLITNIGRAHLEGFRTVEGVLEAKSELYEFLAKNGGTAFLNAKDRMLGHKARQFGVNAIFYNDEKCFGEIMEVYPFLTGRIHNGGQETVVKTKLVGAYNLENIIPAVAIGSHFGISARDIFAAIESYVPEIKRSQLIEGKRNRVILDAYNANPTSMRKSISDFNDYGPGKKLVILGDMYEMGDAEQAEHRDLIEWIHDLGIDKALFVGNAFMNALREYPGYRYFPDVRSCIDYLDGEKLTGYYILIKGSRKMTLESLSGHL